MHDRAVLLAQSEGLDEQSSPKELHLRKRLVHGRMLSRAQRSSSKTRLPTQIGSGCAHWVFGGDAVDFRFEALSPRSFEQLVSRERVDFTFAGCFRTMTYVVDCCCAGAAERPR